ncbi:MAG TPA: LysE family translocator [Steroidobacter sp.]
MSFLAAFDAETLVAYTIAASALVIAPGPGQALVVARTIQGGTRAGVLTAFGLQVGTLVHTIAAAIGLSAILAASATAFTVVKYLGAVYLIVLGATMLRKTWSGSAANGEVATAPRVRNGALILHAFATGVLNPKVAIFFLAFLPQFVHPERGGVFGQFLVLGLILMGLGVAGDSTVAWLTGRARARVAASPRFTRWRDTVTGTVLVALGLRLAFVQRT